MAAVLICPNPGCRSEGTGRFCNRCGADLTMIACPSCGHRHGEERLEQEAPVCDECGTSLAPRVLLVLSGAGKPGLAAGARLFDGRYWIRARVDDNRFLAVDTQPNCKRLVGALADGGPAHSYKRLARLPGIPALIDCHRDEDGTEILVLVAPADGDALFEPLSASWQEAPARRKLAWLAAWIELAEATCSAGWPLTALEPSNLLVRPDGTLCVGSLLADAPGADPAALLGELWLGLMGVESGDRTAEDFAACVLARRAVAGEADFRELAAEVDRWRQLPPVSIQHAGRTDVGRRRENNEDTFLSWHAQISQRGPDGATVLSRGLFAVCDGMGGHASGEVAAQTAVAALRGAILPLLEEDDPAAADFPERLAGIVRHDVNSAIYTLNESEPQMTLRRMGTTLVGLVQIDDRVWRVHVGDSRLYRITADDIEQVTEDHNIGTRDVKRGAATLLEAFRSPVGKHLTQALGPKNGDFVHPDVEELATDVPCAFVLCSDGLSDMVPEADLHRIVCENWDDPAAAISRLIDEANAGGGLDNITAILVRLDPAPALFPSARRTQVAAN